MGHESTQSVPLVSTSNFVKLLQFEHTNYPLIVNLKSEQFSDNNLEFTCLYNKPTDGVHIYYSIVSEMLKYKFEI